MSEEEPVNYVAVVNRQAKAVARLRALLFSILDDLDEDSELAKDIWFNLKSEFEGE